MFSSNQVLKISGDLEHQNDLQNSIEFALKKYNNNRMPDSFQITKSGKYVLGFGNGKKGWTSFPFETTIQILTAIVYDYIKKQPYNECNYGDGSCSKGFLIESVQDYSDGIEEQFYSIISISSFACFYHK